MSKPKPFPKNPNGKWIEVSRIQAAKQQLDTAIELFFNSEDAISVHTLVHAVIGILNPIVISKGGKDLELVEAIRPEHRKSWIATLHEAPNFFKHGSSNPDSKVQFLPEWNVMRLAIAMDGYKRVAGWEALSVNMLVLNAWVRLKHPEVLYTPLTDGEVRAQVTAAKLSRPIFFKYTSAAISGKTGRRKGSGCGL